MTNRANRNVWIARALLLPLALSLTGSSALAQAQSSANSAQQPPAPPPSQQTPSPGQQATQPSKGGMVNPAEGPLEPVPSPQTPDQSVPAQQNESATPNAPTPQNKPERPLGAAVGQAAETRGGPASKPAGTAIAPAKQRQVRSLFLKVGAIAAAGAALGAVVALTRGTPSKPPGAK